jgi:uncharacterized membrane protein YphA (DoxX/SURF4 family)
MGTDSGLKLKILHTENDSKIIFARMITGLIFISEGLQKYLIVSMLGPAYFKDIGFGHPEFWAYFTGGFVTFAHLHSIDFALVLLLIMLFIHGGGKWSVDLKILQKKIKTH